MQFNEQINMISLPSNVPKPLQDQMDMERKGDVEMGGDDQMGPRDSQLLTKPSAQLISL
jgi:hypothetical protein